MRIIRCSPWTILVVLVLADAAPAPSCGGSGSETGYLRIGASSCSCAAGTIRVSVDGGEVGELSCGWENALHVSARVGDHVVSASSGASLWGGRTYSVSADRTTLVDLGCPTAASAGR